VAYVIKSASSAAPGRLGDVVISEGSIAFERGMQNHADALSVLASATMYSSATPRGPAWVSEAGVLRPRHAGRKLFSL
jgi:hypothetical protein